ncbi:MAG: L-2-hydroxyglutarate oxidase [Planctomycetes bacterium]|nr:L-2-hydroxyglutarate oxidase [Planctomycetota bacterium]
MLSKDVAIIGGGIVGLATAYRLGERFPDLSIAVLDKEPELACHQTGHNSGVLHSGVYYAPGSLKARNCLAGKLALEEFCQAEGVPHETCGKVIVATCETELPALERIHQRGQANGVTCEMIGPERLREIEPHAAGVRALHVPQAGIVDFRTVCSRLAARIAERGGTLMTGARVHALRRTIGRIAVLSTAGEVEARLVVNCCGLQCDRITRMSGQKPEAKIVPFRGEYYRLTPEAHHLCRHLIYPVPDPSFPFLGVHFTRRIDGTRECGPNAVLAFAREGYRKRDIHPLELLESLTYPGFIRLALRYWRIGLGEMWRSFSKAAFVRALARLVPEIRPEHLEPAPAGVRAQALRPSGELVDDFLIQEQDRVLNVGNAPSPAATASLNIGALLVDRIAERLGA